MWLRQLRAKEGGYYPELMGRIPQDVGAGGLIFALAAMAVFLIGIPALWNFLAGSLLVGGCIALLLHFARR